jgi:hypothetical protein
MKYLFLAAANRLSGVVSAKMNCAKKQVPFWKRWGCSLPTLKNVRRSFPAVNAKGFPLRVRF